MKNILMFKIALYRAIGFTPSEITRPSNFVEYLKSIVITFEPNSLMFLTSKKTKRNFIQTNERLFSI